MNACRVCKFLPELDDRVLRFADGSCLCLRCFNRETGASPVLTKQMTRDLAEVLSRKG